MGQNHEAFPGPCFEELRFLRRQVRELRAQVAEALTRPQEIIEELHQIWEQDPETGTGAREV